MFEKIKEIWGRIRSFMFDKNTVKNAIKAEIAGTDEMYSAVRLWSDMYTDERGMRLPSAIAGEMARLITLELNSKVIGSSRADFINEKYSEFIEKIRIPVEYGCAMGGVIFKPYVADGKLSIDVVRANAFYPTAFDNSGKICGAVFVQRVVKGEKYYTRLEKHELYGTKYTVTNKAYMSLNRDYLGTPIQLDSIDEWTGVLDEVTIDNVSRPLFGYFKPAAANTVDPSSPLGVSVYANAVDLIDDANKQYTRLLWEFESGERALIANSMAFKLDRDGKMKLPNKKLYRTLDVEDMDFFKEWTPTMRESSFIDGLDRIFRRIEFNCGLAYGTLSDVQNNDKTAEEIRASKQRSYATVSDNQKALKNALSDLVYAMDIYCTLYNLAPLGKYEVSFEFDDSIVADRKTEFAEKQALVSLGVMQKWELRAWYFGEDEETAKANTANEFDGVPEL